MKMFLFIIALVLIQPVAIAQRELVKDFDGDNIMDSVFMDSSAAAIVCKLSGSSFKKISSKSVDILNETSGLVATKNDFEFYNHWMRAGHKNQFRFDTAEKR